MTSTVPTKYTRVIFSEEDFGEDQPTRYSTVDFVWEPSKEPLSIAFAILMDKWIETEARKVFATDLDPEKDIYLEDTWLMINWEKETGKENLIKILDVVRRAEERFDAFRIGATIEDQHPGVAEDR
jgi:hypothetical protein